MTQMRVKDQDLIVEQVVKKIEATELEKFKVREDVQSIQSVIDNNIATIQKLHDTYKEYQKNIKDDVKELVAVVDAFQEVNGFKQSHEYGGSKGFRLGNVSGYGSPDVPNYDVTWNLPSNTKRELSVKLRMQTMSGDFDVYKLIEELTTEFSN